MKKFGIALIVLSVAALLLHFVGEYFAIDMCLDAGQVYDYAISQCRTDVDHLPYIPDAMNFSWFITGSLFTFLVGVACVVVGKRNK